MRLFIGIPIPYIIQNRLKEIQDIVLKNALSCKKVPMNLFHVTILFLGEVEVHLLDDIIDLVEACALDVSDFKISLSDLNSFSKKNEHILYIGINEGHKTLKSLHDKMRNLLSYQNIKSDDKPYHPHLTLARKVTYLDHHPDVWIPAIDLSFIVTEIILYQSHQSMGNLTYTPIFRYQLDRQNQMGWLLSQKSERWN